MCAPKPRNILNFMQFLWKFSQNRRLVLPIGLAPPPVGNTGVGPPKPQSALT